MSLVFCATMATLVYRHLLDDDNYTRLECYRIFAALIIHKRALLDALLCQPLNSIRNNPSQKEAEALMKSIQEYDKFFRTGRSLLLLLMPTTL